MKENISHKTYISMMIPFMLSTVTQPLLGAADIAIAGHLSNEKYIAGISIGTLIFNTIYWIFGFLRVSTTGFSAQSMGKKKEASTIFFRPIFIALIISMIFLITQKYIFQSSIGFISPDKEVAEAAGEYFYILIWGAPFVLINYVLLGWLMGQGNIKASMIMQITGNLLNIGLDFLFVLVFHQEIGGIAYATLISQVVSTLIGLYYIIPYGYIKNINMKEIFDKKEIIKIMSVNKDLMLRTFCLLVHNNIFMAASSSLGSTILSANAVLFQLLSIISYLFDGIANTSSVFAGRASGEKNINMMKDIWKKTLQWGLVMVVILTGVYLIFSGKLLGVFTDLPEVLALAEKYSFWVTLYPLLAFGGLTFYGVFTGSSVTLPILYSTAGALIGFLFSWKFIIPIFENNGIWISLLVFYFLRTVFLVPFLNSIIKKWEAI